MPRDVRLEAGEGHQRAEVGGRLDHDRVAGIEQGEAGQRDALHAAAGDDQLVVLRPPALQVLLALEQVLADARDALARRVLERDARVVAEQPRHDLVEHLGRERGRAREPAAHRQHAGRGAGEDRGQLGGALVERALRERPRPVARLSTVDIDLEPQAALLSAVQRRDVLGPVREVVQRARPRAASPRASHPRRGRCARPPRARPRSARRARSRRRRRRRRRCRPGATSTPPQRDRLVQRGPRDGPARARDRAAREHRQPVAPQARDVAAEAVDDDAREPAPLRLGGEQLAEHGDAALAGHDHQHVAVRSPPRAR